MTQANSPDCTDLAELHSSIDKIVKKDPLAFEIFNALIKDYEEGSDDDVEAGKEHPTMQVVSKGQASRRFSLEALHPDLAEILRIFDFDGNGKVTLDEVREGAQLLKKTKKQHKMALWALVVQFVVYALLTALSCGVLYFFLHRMKDMAVDPLTGTLLVKESGLNDGIEVSVKAHGSSFTIDETVIDDATGERKNCVFPSKAAEMFRLASEGTPVTFATEHSLTGDVHLLPLGNGAAHWSSEEIVFDGGLTLRPDASCASNNSRFQESDEGNNRLLSSPLTAESLRNAHLALRDMAMSSIVDGSDKNHVHGGRKLEVWLKDFGYTIVADFDLEIGFIEKCIGRNTDEEDYDERYEFFETFCASINIPYFVQVRKDEPEGNIIPLNDYFAFKLRLFGAGGDMTGECTFNCFWKGKTNYEVRLW